MKSGSPEKITGSPRRRDPAKAGGAGERKGFVLVFLRVLGVFAVQLAFSQ